jgi:hypothetical protein
MIEIGSIGSFVQDSPGMYDLQSALPLAKQAIGSNEE